MARAARIPAAWEWHIRAGVRSGCVQGAGVRAPLNTLNRGTSLAARTSSAWFNPEPPQHLRFQTKSLHGFHRKPDQIVPLGEVLTLDSICANDPRQYSLLLRYQGDHGAAGRAVGFKLPVVAIHAGRVVRDDLQGDCSELRTPIFSLSTACQPLRCCSQPVWLPCWHWLCQYGPAHSRHPAMRAMNTSVRLL